ncbi:MAG TPA: hypothetical protein P5543_09280 [Planctomycetota bacterium]|nr:hypothetical protein [Planctomycetota bacterium]HRU52371.1 hypothetical protein [Planctomycetota bacterium]
MSIRKKIKRMRNKILISLAKYTVPYIYILYIKFVWATSKIITELDVLDKIYEQEDKRVVALLWHQDVFSVAWAYRKYEPITMANVGDSGEIISKILQLCGYTYIWRGGSSKSRKRKVKILDQFIKDYKTNANRVVGLTVDGSSGPVFHLKRGGLVISQQCRVPIVLLRIWPKKRIHCPTWDKMVIPKPFNIIKIKCVGPYYIEPTTTDEEFEAKRAFIENELLEFTYETAMEIDKKFPSVLAKQFPEGWEPQWTVGQNHSEEPPISWKLEPIEIQPNNEEQDSSQEEETEKTDTSSTENNIQNNNLEHKENEE